MFLKRDISVQALPLFLKIRADHPNAQYFAYYLEYLTFHLPDGMLVPALEYLVKNKMTGERFLKFINEDCQRSALELLRHMTMRLERSTKLRTLTRKDIRA